MEARCEPGANWQSLAGDYSGKAEVQPQRIDETAEGFRDDD
jgi:hypothetical protein